MEVEGRLEVEEESMTGWCQVRRKGGQVEKDVAAVSRGWEEYKIVYPHLAHGQRHMSEEEWKRLTSVEMWLRGCDQIMEYREEMNVKEMS